MASAVTIKQALSALNGMREIVRHEMLTRGTYIDDEVSNPKLAKNGSICGGRKHCAVGSLWAGAGVKPEIGFDESVTRLPGVSSDDRYEFLKPRHGLRTAYDALNEAASEFAKQNNMRLSLMFSAPIEALFEGNYGDALTKHDMLKIIAAAKRKVVKQGQQDG